MSSGKPELTLDTSDNCGSGHGSGGFGYLVQKETRRRMTTKFTINTSSRRLAFSRLAALCGTALLVLSGCATQAGDSQSGAECDEGYICSNFPGHVAEAIQKLESSSFGCDNPKVYLENHAVNFKSPNGPDTLTCNEYYVDDNDYFFGEKFDVFESESELEMYYSDACDEELFMNNWRVSPNVMFSDINYEYVDEASADMAAKTLSAGFTPVQVAFACDVFK